MCALWLLGGAARAEDVEGSRDETQDAPLLAKRSQTPAAEVPAGPHELIVFRGTLLFNEYVYRAILQLPADAKATHETARKIAGAIALFLRDAGYELATVRAQVVGDQIEVQVDEGQLDKIILANAGAVTTVRFKLELNLPRDVFNRRELERQLPILARRFHLRSYAYELWPAQRPLFDDEGPQLGDVEELRAVPLFRGGRAYELRILADPDPWGEGFGPEVVINGRVGVEAGGRVRFRDSLQEGDRSEIRLRGAGAVDSYLNMPGSRLVLSHLLGEGRWFGRSWTGGDNGLRPAVEFKSELWGLQREDLQLEHYNLGSIEGAAGVGALLDPRFGFALTAGLQRRWLFALQNLRDPAYTQITDVPAVENRAFARLLGQFTFNPGDLRRDQRSLIEFELAGFTPYKSGGSPFLRAAIHGRKIWTFNWHELWLTGRATGLAGDVQFVDQEPVADHLRLGFGGTVYVNGITSGRVEFRFSILRDLFKVSLFNDLGTFRQANPADQSDRAVIGGSSGAGLHVLVVDHFQLDGYVGTGWTNTGYQRPGFLLNIKDAF